MKILFIGGTGTISMAITRLLAEQNHELYLINRGSRSRELPDNVHIIQSDIQKPNPRDTLIYQGITLCRKESVDFILSVGGGSLLIPQKRLP